MEVIGLEDDVLAQLQKLQSAQLGSNIIGQLVMDCIVKPPKEGDPSYKQFMEVLMHYLPTASQSAFACSKLTIETLEQGVKICSKVTIKTPEPHQLVSFWCLYC